MKKYIFYILLFIFIIFVIPALCTRGSIETLAIEQNSQDEDIKKYDYLQYATIKLYHTDTETTEEIPLDEYLYGVVSAEMPADYELEALKAQAVVARTYTIYQISNNNKHGDANICDDSACCQAWISKEDRMNRWDEDKREENWAKITKAVDSTSGSIVTYEGNPINAFFHSNSGGTTEVVSNVWGGTDLPYLQSVETSGEADYSQYNSEVVLTKDELLNKLKENYSDIEINFENSEDIKILEYTDSGRVKTIKFGNKELSGTETRTLLGLRSTNFTFSIDGDNITFSVVGYGHGVGMSQTGADSMAKQGSNYEDIIKHFYTGVEITYVNDLN